ncbi:MAG TPA: FAD-linked oxidase C-terminal domain-containing protein [Burkholderiaceae bacterium]|nr:FAD-linked oxidase C-terminal domain-containing protein [Burkholderiaceae bacterium]
MNAPERIGGARRVFLSPRLARSDLATRLRREMQGDVLFDAGSRGRYATDASIYQVEPIGVAVPRTEADLAIALDVARDLKVPVLPRGGGTSQCGQTVGQALVIDHSKWLNQVVDFDAARAKADPGSATVTVQPGLALDALNAYLKPHGLWFPVDVSTSAQATIGGMAGNNSCGSRSIAYGNMVHNVVGIDAILADGTQAWWGTFTRGDGSAGDMSLSTQRVREIVSGLHAIADRERDEIRRVWPTVMRRVGGYNLDVFEPRSERPYTADGSLNLAHLLVGSEGTLAWSRRLTLKLSPLPGAKVLGVVSFPTFEQSMALTKHIVGLGPAAVELVDRTMIELSRANPAFRPTIDAALVGEPQAVLLVEFAGESRAEQLARLARLHELMADLGLPGSVVDLADDARQKALWEVRKAGLNIMMSMKGDGKPVSFIEDCAVPLEHLAEYTSRLTEVFRRHGTQGTWYAHASVGTLHVRPILDMRAGDASRMRAIAEEAAAMVREYKGAFSGEHGDGLVRSEWVAWQFGPRIVRAFEEVKGLFDPENRMNPGKIVRPARMDDESLFRFPPGYAVAPIATALDWSDWDRRNDPSDAGPSREGFELEGNGVAVSAPGTGGDPSGGFAKAVEMCNNNGHCRKFDAGTMCPSYRATRDEQHVTRGRANTLRLAVSGQLGADGLASPEVRDALDLCVQCKGCKRECPTGVDMARMKTEFLHHWNARHGASAKARLIASLPRWAPWAARLAPLSNLRDAVPGLAALSERLLGLSAKRTLPRFRRDGFLRSLGRDGAAAAAATDAREVVLWVDTFDDHLEPDNARAALAVLRAAGYRVHVAGARGSGIAEGERALCCGRTWLSAGMVDEARAEALRTLRALLPFAERGVPIVGIEPSCLLTLRDEFLALRLDDAIGRPGAARTLASGAKLLEEFLAAEHAAGRLELRLKPLPQARALVHGHCHQKALDAFSPTLAVLRLIPGLKVEAIESSCCGMAGSFGYEASHHEVSMRMAEASLLPAVRAAGPDALIVANGTSCRHQIADGAGRDALHVARVLERALA